MQDNEKHLKITQLDVNEDNPKALGFYKHGFETIGRSELDGMGKPLSTVKHEIAL